MNKRDKYDQLYKELIDISKEIKPFYSIDKIKYYAVFVCIKKDNDFDENVFDITKDGIIPYNTYHVIPNEVIPIIKKIQNKLKEIDILLNEK